MRPMTILIGATYALAASGAVSAELSVTTRDMQAIVYTTSIATSWGLIGHRYKSHSANVGALGKGWCSQAETRRPQDSFTLKNILDIKARYVGDLVAFDICGTGEAAEETIFYGLPKGGKTQNLRDYAVQLKEPLQLEFRKRTKPVLVEEDGETWDVAPEVKLSSTGISMREYSGGSISWKFDLDGTLTDIGEAHIRNGEDGRIEEILTTAGPLKFSYSFDRSRLTSITSSEERVEFKYDGRQSLTSIVSATGNVEKFIFGDTLLLEELVRQDGIRSAIFYDQSSGNVTDVIHPLGCVETYRRLSGESDNAFRIQANYHCNGKDLTQISVSYQFNENGDYRMSEQVTEENDQSDRRSRMAAKSTEW